MSSNHAKPILYLNVAGELLYVLQFFFDIKNPGNNYCAQVYNELIFALLKPKQLQMIFEPGPVMSLPLLWAIFDRVVLSTNLKPVVNTVRKMYEFMITMMKYQLTTASGPREIILSTLNHIDAIRDMAVDKMLTKHIDNAHQLILDTYGKMTYKEIWQIRSDCLREIHDHNMCFSVLVRRGMQNQDASFNRMIQRYDEKYLERREVLENIKVMDYDDEESMGCFSFFGDRVTQLGRTLYPLSTDTQTCTDTVVDPYKIFGMSYPQ